VGGRLGAALATLTLVLLLPLAVFVSAAWLKGWQLMSVQSGSMAPTYPIDSLLVVGAVDPTEVQPGMAIVFEDPTTPGRVVTHRVVSRAGDAVAFVTQGDANGSPDPVPVTARLIRGRVLWHVPGLGLALDWLQWPRSFVLLVLIPGILLVGSELRERRRRANSKRISREMRRRLAELSPLDRRRSA
jgi:signal peptidase